jgi:hypothetical protein
MCSSSGKFGHAHCLPTPLTTPDSGDSEIRDGIARLTPHTAFVDPSTPADAPMRESIELRTLVFYE